MTSATTAVPGESQDAAAQAQGRTLHQAIGSLTSEVSVDKVLQKVADLSRQLVGAAYSAIGIVGEDGNLVQFITSGISQKGRDRIARTPEGKGVLGVVLKEGKALRLPDLSQHPESVGFPRHHPRMRSFLGVPIVFKGRMLGNLYLTNKIGADCFSPEDETLMAIFAAHAAVAIENARLFQSETRRSAQLDGLKRIGSKLAGILDLEQLLRTVASLLHEEFDYQNVQVLWVDGDAATLRVRALAGLTQGRISPGVTWPSDQGIAGWVVKNRQTALCNDVSEDPRYVAIPGFEPCSILAVPVIVKGRAAAVIRIDGMEPKAFDDSDVKILETLADHLAVAIENLQLYRRQEEHSLRLAVVEERDRIGRDLHDGVIQSIYAVGLTLEDIAVQMGEGLPEVRRRLRETVEDLNQVIRSIRSYIMDLCPLELQGRPLDEALDSLIEHLEQRAGVSVQLISEIDLAGLSERYAVNLWHIFQEAFSNIEKYAGARTVSVTLPLRDGSLDLEIADDGAGFDLENAELGRGYGLSNIKDRSERLGGVMVVDTAPGRGTKLRVRLPMDGATRAAPGVGT